MNKNHLIVLVGAGFLGWYAWSKYQASQQAAAITQSNALATAAVSQAASTTVSGVDGPYQGIG